MRSKDRLPLIHPGEVLREEYLVPLGVTAQEPAPGLRAPASRINDIVNEKGGITADTALRRSGNFGVTARSRLNLQASDEFQVAEDKPGQAVAREALSGNAA
jgi:addiction module HigA family antidote